MKCQIFFPLLCEDMYMDEKMLGLHVKVLWFSKGNMFS